MNPRKATLIVAGAALCLALSAVATRLNGPAFIGGLERQAAAARDAAGGIGVTLAFRDTYDWQTRHPILSGGKGLDTTTRTRIAEAVAEVPGIGGISWVQPKRASAPNMQAQALAARDTQARGGTPLHCQDEVQGILKTRTIRFSEASARIDPASERLLDEVARALGPCVGSIIAVTGYTDAGGNPRANEALSLARADAVRWALVGRGIPADGLRAVGKGSKTIEGLDPLDPANRRIEFSVIFPAPVKPTPIDTPAAE